MGYSKMQGQQELWGNAFTLALCTWMAAVIFDLQWLSNLSIAFALILGCAFRWVHHRNPISGVPPLSYGKLYFAASVPFFLILFSGIYTQNIPELFKQLEYKMVFLAVPLSFWLAPGLSTLQAQRILALLIVLILCSGLWILIQFLEDPQFHIQRLKHGGYLPITANHIRYSLFTAIATLGALILGKSGYTWEIGKSWVSYLLFGLLLIYLHALAVRSGILACYAGLGAMGICTALARRKLTYALVPIGLVLVLPVLAYMLLPSFQNKVDYSIRDFNNYFQGGDPTNYSDGERWVSYAAGLDIFLDQPVLGTGYADVLDEIKTWHSQHMGHARRAKLPHNQWLFLLCGTGIAGTLFFALGFFYPYRFSWLHNAAFWGFQALILTSFLMENTLDSFAGISVYLIFHLLIIKYFQPQHES